MNIKSIFIAFGILCIVSAAVIWGALRNITTSEQKDPKFINEKFVVESIGDYSYLIKHISVIDTTAQKTDTLYTILNKQNYFYNQYKEQDQFFNSYKEGDTIVIKSIKKNKFWIKLN